MVQSVVAVVVKSCENWCSGIYRPLCANDGSLYSSKCMLDFNNCLAENRGEPLLTIDNESVIIDGKCFKKVFLERFDIMESVQCHYSFISTLTFI